MQQAEKVFEVAGEGGGLCVYRAKLGNRFVYRLVTDDATPTFLDESAINNESDWKSSIDGAVMACEWPWNNLSPIFLHSDYIDDIRRLKQRADLDGGVNRHVQWKWEKILEPR